MIIYLFIGFYVGIMILLEISGAKKKKKKNTKIHLPDFLGSKSETPKTVGNVNGFTKHFVLVQPGA